MEKTDPKLLLQMERLKREKARRRLIDFVKYNFADYDVNWHHKLLSEKLEAVERGEIRRLIVNMPPRAGKQLANHTPIFTTKGWLRHGDLKVGDEVFGLDGKPKRVLAVSPELEQNMAVEFTNGETIECHANHEWILYDRAGAKRRIIQTKDLAKRSLEVGIPGKRGHRYTLQLPERDALITEERPLPIDPYVLGVWLGDGTTTKNCITYCQRDKAVIERCAELGYAPTSHNTHKITGVHSDYIKRLYGELRDANLLGNKHIPETYFLASLEQRKSLMAGLIDTDGYVDRDGRAQFSTCMPKLRDDVVRLAITLGAEPYFSTAQPRMSSSGIQGRKEVFKVMFYLDFPIPVALSRKQTGKAYQKRQRAVKAVRFVPPSLGKCIEVEGGIYLAGERLIPTHNSTLVSTYFPAWYLGKHPDREVVVASYSADLAVGFGRATRNLVRQNEYKNLFKVSLAEDSRSVGNWHTEKGGSYIAVGVGGALTGKGADLLIIDDPIKGRQEAESDIVRDALWDWYRSTAYTRLSPIGAIVICQTRWTDDDLVGRLLTQGDEKSDKWEMTDFKSIAEKDDEYRKIGEALWPNRFPLERLQEIRANIGPYEFASLHQQDPVDVEHQEFKPRWFKHRTFAEVQQMETRKFLTIDTAISEKASADYTGWVENYVDQEGNWNIRAKRFRISPGFLINMLFDSFREQQWEKIGIEKGIYSQSIKQFVDDEMRKRGVFLPITEIDHRGTFKEVRIRGLVPRYERGAVYHIDDNYKDLEDELIRFPKARHDDLSDALAYQIQIAERPFPQDAVVRYDMAVRRNEGGDGIELL